MSEMDEIVHEFLLESREGLDHFERDLLALEHAPQSPELLASVFRVLHTVKGTAGLLGFTELERVAHVAESLLGTLRDGGMTFTTEIAGILLATGDAIGGMLTAIEDTDSEGDTDHGELVATLTRLQNSPETAERLPEKGPGAAPVPRLGEILVDRGLITPEDAAEALDEQQRGDPRHIGEILVEQGVVAPQDVVEALATQQDVRGATVAESSIRVDVGLLDELMNLVGELVLVRNRIVELAGGPREIDLAAAAQRLNHLTGELHDRVAKTRMQPVNLLWGKFPRLVRDLAAACGKQVRLDIAGADTELDRSILEAIRDPLTHLVRNAVDHGLEPVDERVAAGKPTEGRVSLRAFHESGQVHIEIADDGRGIDPDTLRAAAVRRGLMNADSAAALSEREALHLIFAAGLSTAKELTNVSGRGVGMDVVRVNVERIGGAVDVRTERGRGTVFTVTIPLTLAIVPALVVVSGGQRYVIPQAAVGELVRLGDTQQRGIEWVHDSPTYRLRGRLIPVLDLSDVLGNDRATPEATAQGTSLVVLQADGGRFGLVVDGVEDIQDIVVKPLGRQLRGISVYAGATIMGNGQVALILDVAGVAQQASAVSANGEERPSLDEDSEVTAGAQGESLLLVALADARRAAIPLAAVSRLETVSGAAVEQSAIGWVMQSRGGVVPLVDLSAPLGAGRLVGVENGDLHVIVVHGPGGRRIGLVVSDVIDVAEQPGPLEDADQRPGLAGVTVIDGRVTDVVALDGLLAVTAPAAMPVVEEEVA